LSALDVRAYLGRLGVRDPGAPSVEALHVLHRAHVERIPYENLEIQLERPTTVDPVEAAERIVRRGRGGYCYHLNGAFSELLGALGYRVTRHLGGVQRTHLDPPGATGNHMALTVDGLPHETCPAGVWFVDVGLGATLYEPLPLHEDVYRQGPFEYALRRSPAVAAGWRFDNDARAGFAGMDFRTEAAEIDDFAAMHEHLSTAPESRFVQVAVVQRRDEAGADVLCGLVLTRVGSAPAMRTLETRAEWFELLADLFGLGLADVGTAERERLWKRVLTAHTKYQSMLAPSGGSEP